MNFERISQMILNNYNNEEITTTCLITVLLMVCLLSIYEFFVYRVVSHRAFYNRSLNITVTILPFFIATIILCLQSNIVITLGTIGALAIVRFRTAVKDPVDMIYILWSIHTGIICGCQLYKVAVLTSLVVTLVLIAFNYIKIGGKSYCLVVRLETCENEEIFLESVKQFVKHYRIKNRNYSGKGVDYVIEGAIKEPREFSVMLEKQEIVERFSLMEYDAEDIV